ncbi:class I SAM-dependent methyltransferase [Tundrisphaera lichenicola]|uniref:class I SAM-dependent methyltransferase n=1 Tax=Tundrisphaera lichenicola TaxID=2029860 RepID=UPI003EB80D92
MSLPHKLARGVRRPIASVLTLARHSASYPFDTPMTREVHSIERRSSEKALRAMKDLPGLEGPPRHGLPGLAYQVVRHYNPHVVVELGILDGLEALAIGTALRDNNESGRLFLVDPRAGEEPHQSLLARRSELGLDDAIVPLGVGNNEAREQVARPVDLLLIDARRTAEAVEADFESYWPIVRPGGIVLFLGVTSSPEIRPFWRKMTRNHENHTVRRFGGVGFIRIKQH